ncbi:transporter [Elysia marginata]|uniref:Transporter n=1 Tax=Elysia marginata TaxID=1093978 RepID=A0AAV4F8U9_9GAST|nr:transporter [Elysia marginata]
MKYINTEWIHRTGRALMVRTQPRLLEEYERTQDHDTTEERLKSLQESCKKRWQLAPEPMVLTYDSSILWLPGIALARKIGLLRYDHAKVVAADLHRTTDSTTKFLGSQFSTRSEDRDSGRDSEGDDILGTDVRVPERPAQFTLGDILATPTRGESSSSATSRV